MAQVHPALVGVAWILGGLLVAYVAVSTGKLLEHVARRAKALLTAALIDRIRIPAAIAIVLAGVLKSLPSFGRDEPWVHKMILSALIVVGAYAVIVAATTFLTEWVHILVRKSATRTDDNFLPLFQGFFKLLILALAFAWILTTWGVHIGPLLAGLGVAGLAVGLALQKTMANIIGGMAIIMDETYNVGDTVHLDTGEVGEVVHIGLRSTKILTEDDQLMVLPNDVMANAKIINYSLPSPRLRVVLDVGVDCDANVGKAQAVMQNALKGIAGIIHTPLPVVQFKNIGESSLNFQIKFFIEHYRNRHEIRSIANQRVVEALRKAKISIPYPTRTVYLKK
jgi:MscS family membrane protein